MAELRIEQLLREMVNRKASDLHLRVGVPPVYRINGALQRLFDVRIDSAMMDSFLDDIMNRDQKQRFEANKECDFAVGARDMGRFRVNVFRQRGTIAVVIRHIKAVIPPFEELHLPEIIRDLALTRRGLVLVTGTTGSGKSTTLASMIDYINQKESVNVITVEDPIEYLYRDNVAIISQREIGVDTLSYANALRAALRQDPDVLLVGEIRDLETMQIAMTATWCLRLSIRRTPWKRSTVCFRCIRRTSMTKSVCCLLKSWWVSFRSVFCRRRMARVESLLPKFS